MPLCLTLSIISYGSKVKLRNPEDGVVLSPHIGVVAIEKGAIGSSSTTVTKLSYLYTERERKRETDRQTELKK